MRKPIKVEDAIHKVMTWTLTGSKEMVPLPVSANRVLAEDLTATNDVPWFTRSPYDGYALFSGSTAAASADHPVFLEVLGTIGAGFTWDEGIRPGQAVKIMTGAAVPDGADAVIMVELTKEIEKGGKTYVQIKRRVHKGENIVHIGEDMKKGETLVAKGTVINPGVMAALATFGYQQVAVMKKPKAAIIATGSELLEVDASLEKGKIRDSNAYMLQAQILRAGGEPSFYCLVQDDFEETCLAVKQALQEADIVMTTGGVSVGDFDYIPQVYEKLGAELLFNKVAMRPGSVTSAAVLDGKIIFGLSGNPSSCYVGFELFVRPYIKAMSGQQNVFLKKVQAVLEQDFLTPNPFTRFVRARAGFSGNVLHAGPVRLDKPNIVSSLIEANALIMLPGGSRGFKRGEDAEVLLLEDDEGAPVWDEKPAERF
ncbi:gephyrin-like molybdotransferase Glp [Heyndrickxia acidiproducens]|uniref:molybdopterin molybdotransferase MoeA n=1 Tax=Heyndrickxia acidiproducens TaxID=1121084 RepID=UPI0003629EDF|nr:gephyrin-like molybdotransferase Glp [Heyndrickxia acidiproducens]